MVSDPKHFYLTLEELLTDTISEKYPQFIYSPLGMKFKPEFDGLMGGSSMVLACQPRNLDTYGNFTCPGAPNALIYCDLISQQCVGGQ